jgi:hypothetical protein
MTVVRPRDRLMQLKSVHAIGKDHVFGEKLCAHLQESAKSRRRRRMNRTHLPAISIRLGVARMLN